MSRWGITLPLTGVPLMAHRDLVRELPDLGYTDVWSAETAGTDAFSPLLLAAEWAPLNIRVNAVAPGYVKTEMAPVDEPRFKARWIDDAPMQRYAVPEEIAPTVVFLAPGGAEVQAAYDLP